MAQGGGVVVEGVQLLHALEAIIDVQGPGGQGVIGIDALLDSSPHVVVFEGQAVAALIGLHHAVLAVPDLRPAGGRVHGAVGHGTVQVVGKREIGIVFGGGCVLVQAVGRVGPRHARLAGCDAIADLVVCI